MRHRRSPGNCPKHHPAKTGGITNCETADYALERKIDLIITDHHKDIRDEMPKAYAVVNPNRRDEPEDSQLRALAGVGVAFAVCLKVKNILDARGDDTPSIYPLLQFVAIGTICDLAKLNFMNIFCNKFSFISQ